MIKILKKYPDAHFGFLGAHVINFSEGFEEKRFQTKRWRIYKYAFECLIGDHLFEHEMDVDNSTYMILNRNAPDLPKVKARAEKMFVELFPELDGI